MNSNEKLDELFEKLMMTICDLYEELSEEEFVTEKQNDFLDAFEEYAEALEEEEEN